MWGDEMGSAVIDLASIRTAAQEGLPVLPQTILALLDELEKTHAALDYWTNGDALHDLLGEVREARQVVSAARAWVGAIAEQNMDAIEAAEKELIVAIARCGV